MTLTEILARLEPLGPALVRLENEPSALPLRYRPLTTWPLRPVAVVDYGMQPLLYLVTDEGAPAGFDEAVSDLRRRLILQGHTCYLVLERDGSTTLSPLHFAKRGALPELPLADFSALDCLTLAVKGIGALPQAAAYAESLAPPPAIQTSRQLLPELLLTSFRRLKRGTTAESAALLVTALLSARIRRDLNNGPAIASDEEARKATLIAVRELPIPESTRKTLEDAVVEGAADAEAQVMGGQPVRPGKPGWSDLDFRLIPACVVAEAADRLLYGPGGPLSGALPIAPYEVATYLLHASESRMEKAAARRGTVRTFLSANVGGGLFLLACLEREAELRQDSPAIANLVGLSEKPAVLGLAHVVLTLGIFKLRQLPGFADAGIMLDLRSGSCPTPADFLVGAWPGTAVGFKPIDSSSALKPGGVMALVYPSGAFHSLDAGWPQLRMRFFQSTDVGGLLDFSSLAYSPFFKHFAAFTAVLARHTTPHPRSLAWFNPAPRVFDGGRRIALGDGTRALRFAPAEVIAPPWKMRAMLKAEGDGARALHRLASIPTLGSQLGRFGITARVVGASRYGRPFPADFSEGEPGRRLVLRRHRGYGKFSAVFVDGDLKESVFELRAKDAMGAAWLIHVRRCVVSPELRSWTRVMGENDDDLQGEVTLEELLRIPIPPAPDPARERPAFAKIYGLADDELRAYSNLWARIDAAQREDRGQGQAASEEDVEKECQAILRKLRDLAPDTEVTIRPGLLLGPWWLIVFAWSAPRALDITAITDRLCGASHLGDHWIRQDADQVVLARGRAASRHGFEFYHGFSAFGDALNALRCREGSR